MPQPTQTGVHVDAVLSNISVAYIPKQEMFIASKAFAQVPVEHQTDKFWKYTKDDWFRDEARRRADASESSGSGYNLGTDSYACDVFAHHKDIGDKTLANADKGLNLHEDATRFVTTRLLLRQELQFVTDVFGTSIWGTDITGATTGNGSTTRTYWSDYANSDPIEDVEDGKETILKNTGYMPNVLLIGYQVWRKLKNHPLFVDRVKYTNSEALTKEIIARYFEVDEILVAQSIKNTAREGASGSYSFAFGKSALLMYRNPTPGLLEPSAGYTFVWNGVSGNLGLPVAISSFRMEHLKAERIEGEAAWDNKIIATDLGYFFSNIVA